MSWGIGDRVGVAVGIGNISSFLSKSIQSRGPQPSLVLDFAGTGTLDSHITFTRSTTGTYYNSSGVLSTAAIDVPRFDYNPSTKVALGLLIEQSSTNLITYSQDFSNVVWNKTVSLGGTTTAPDGTNTGQLIYPTVSGAFKVVYQITAGLTSSKYTWAIYGKAQNKSWLYFNPTGGGTTNIYFNLSTNQVGTIASGYTASIQDVGNGWRRCVVTDATNQAYSFGAIIGVCDADGSGTATANGTDGIYIWGSQTENLTFPTSYIPTVASQVTRAADNASITGTNFTSFYNSAQGTAYIDAVYGNTSAAATGFVFYNTSPVNDYWQLIAIGTNQANGKVSGANVSLNIGQPQLNTSAKVAFAVSNGTWAASVNGGNAVTTSANIPQNINSLYLGTSNQGNFYLLNGYIKKFVYYPTALTSAQLKALTT
jgi:hypothetical protein